MSRVLLLEDDIHLSQALAHGLRQAQFVVTVARTLDQAYRCVQKRVYDVAVIDRWLPDGDGVDLVGFLHEHSYATKIMVLTYQNSDQERIKGLHQGADDYLGKPTSLEECLLRIQLLIGREKRAAPDYLAVGDLKLYPANGLVLMDGRAQNLRKKEIDILKCLFRHKNSVVTKQTLITEVWGYDEELPTYSTIDVYLRRLRSLLGKHGKYIQTIRGFGYAACDRKIPALR